MRAVSPPAVLYWVYGNFPNNKAVGHVSTCSHFKKQGGNALRTGRWHGPFDTRQTAIQVGQAPGRPFHWCSFC